MKEEIAKRVERLRTYMVANGLQAFIVPSTDAHASEYVPTHWSSREWISGFNGSAGTAVVTLNEAALWTDSRYFLAAVEQLENTPFTLMKERVEGTPTPTEWLKKQLKPSDTVGIDGGVFRACDADTLRAELATGGIRLNDAYDPFCEIWTDRPPLPSAPVEVHPLKYAGVSVASKLEHLRQRIHKLDTEGILVSALDEVAWLLNLRGTDVHCNPVFVAYCLLIDNETALYIQRDKLTQKATELLTQSGISILPYEQIATDLSKLSHKRMLLPFSTNTRMATALSHCTTRSMPSPVAEMKAKKNETEIEGFHQAMLRDGVALVKFLRWLKPAVAQGGITEIDVDRKLTSLRSEQALYRGISFDTIAGYADHGAIVHYEATPQTNRLLEPKGLLLLDSGAQYLDGTTDITRTIALGEPTEEEKHIYTLVLKGHIALSRLKFPEGASGTQLDLAARYAMWQEGYNFGHGTGHGVGSYLNVHEGPHQIRMNWMPAPLVSGMTVTDEPGLYLTGKFGVRTENMLLVVAHQETAFGKFLGFEPLTLCPIDTTPIDFTLLNDAEIAWLNDYHRTVREKLLPLLTDAEDRAWLEENTKEISPISTKLGAYDTF